MKLLSKSYEKNFKPKFFDVFLANLFSIIDDLLATGGTAACIEKMLLTNNKKVNNLSVVVELPFLNGRKNLKCEVASVVKLD